MPDEIEREKHGVAHTLGRSGRRDRKQPKYLAEEWENAVRMDGSTRFRHDSIAHPVRQPMD